MDDNENYEETKEDCDLIHNDLQVSGDFWASTKIAAHSFRKISK